MYVRYVLQQPFPLLRILQVSISCGFSASLKHKFTLLWLIWSSKALTTCHTRWSSCTSIISDWYHPTCSHRLCFSIYCFRQATCFSILKKNTSKGQGMKTKACSLILHELALLLLYSWYVQICNDSPYSSGCVRVYPYVLSWCQNISKQLLVQFA